MNTQTEISQTTQPALPIQPIQIGVILDVDHKSPWTANMSNKLLVGHIVEINCKFYNGNYEIITGMPQDNNLRCWYAHESSVEIIGTL